MEILHFEMCAQASPAQCSRNLFLSIERQNHVFDDWGEAAPTPPTAVSQTLCTHFPRMLAYSLNHIFASTHQPSRGRPSCTRPDGPWTGQQEAGPEPGWQQKQPSSVVQRRTPARRHWTVHGPKTGMHDNIIAPRLIRGRAIAIPAHRPLPTALPGAHCGPFFRATLAGAVLAVSPSQYPVPVPGLVPVPVAGRRMLGHPNKA